MLFRINSFYLPLKNFIVFITILIINNCYSQVTQKNYAQDCSHNSIIHSHDNKDDLYIRNSYTFSNKNQIGIKYYIEEREGEKKLFAITLINCHDGKKLFAIDDIFILNPCEIDFKNDTLYVKEINLFALGKGDSFVSLSWRNNLFYYDANNKIDTLFRFNNKIHYDNKHIAKILKEYSLALSKQIDKREDEKCCANEEAMRYANRLMIASISGSEQAVKYFEEFKNMFIPSGAHAEWYYEMKEILEFAKKNKH